MSPRIDHGFDLSLHRLAIKGPVASEKRKKHRINATKFRFARSFPRSHPYKDLGWAGFVCNDNPRYGTVKEQEDITGPPWPKLIQGVQPASISCSSGG